MNPVRKFIDFILPWSPSYDALGNFKNLELLQKIKAIGLTVIAGIFTFGVGITPTFRYFVGHFSSPTTVKIDRVFVEKMVVKNVDHSQYKDYYIGIGEEHIKNFEKIERIICSGWTEAEIIKQLKNEELDGYLHTSSEWAGKEKALIANAKNGIGLLHEAVKLFGVEKTTQMIQGTSNPCFHGVVDSLQALLASEYEDIMLFVVNLDPNHSPIQRAAELVRVYRNEQAGKLLKEQHKDANKANIDALPNEEIPLFTAENICQWSIDHRYIGPGTPSVKEGVGVSGILSEQEALEAIREVLSYL